MIDLPWFAGGGCYLATKIMPSVTTPGRLASPG
jgi:hypothetical protein